MFEIEFLNILIRAVFFNISINYVFIKNTNTLKLTKLEWLIMILNNILVAIIFIALRRITDLMSAYFISYILYSLMMKLIVKKEISDIIIIIIISIALAFVAVGISGIVYYLLFMQIPLFYINYANEIFYKEILFEVVNGVIIFVLIYSFFKIKRFKHGFSFIKETSKIKDKNFIALIIGIIVLTMGIIMGIVSNETLLYFFGFALLILGYILYKWVRKQMKEYYKAEVLYETIDRLKAEVKEKEESLARVLKQNHNFSHRISAMELSMETANEITPDLSKAIKTLVKDFRQEHITATNFIEIPTTNVLDIDSILNYMSEEAEKDNIEFKLKINDSITYMTQNIIPEGKLATIISNHIRNSIIAINSRNATSKSILTMLGLANNCYEFSVYDTGIEFEIDTLVNIGLEQVTTHKNAGGSGIGLMTTWEILKECNASLIIEENDPNETIYKKAVTIRFDEKSEYRIKSYRKNEIKKADTNSRIIIEEEYYDTN
ncbi:MAG: hypothetical protein FWC68_02195 [Oscillospiraceae bacterium]|nr:hypothetical protein [Oscillospiraceae bacterium]